MRKLFVIGLVAACLGIVGSLESQTATATITISTSVTTISVNATNGSNSLVCTVAPNNTGLTAVAWNCKRNGVQVPPQVFDTSLLGGGYTYSLNVDGNSVAVLFQQSNPVGTLQYQVTANGVVKAGTF